MKVKLFLLCLMCMASGIIYAQEGEGKSHKGQRPAERLTVEERAKEQADRLKKDLELTDTQYESVKEINLKYAKKAEEVFKNNEEDRSKHMECLKKNQEEQNLELKAVLTEAQYTKYEEQLKARKEKRGGKHPRGEKSKKSKTDC
jgi:anion-transporting  ArsA/GET3 family ATPase